ncbi:MAG: 2OG-Fe dioxygenase family protein, partial [Betaproteobacteria bacterium]
EGTTTIHDAAGVKLTSFTLTQPLDLMLVDDERCLHGVTPVVPIDPTMHAYRDVLVITFRVTTNS